MTETPVSAPPGLLYRVAADYQAALEALDADAAYRLALAWVDVSLEQQAALDDLLGLVAARREAGLPTSPSWLYREQRYREFLRVADEQAQRFGGTAAEVVRDTQARALGLGQSGAAAAGSAAVAQAGVAAAFVTVNPDTLRGLVGFLADGSPLTDLLASLAPESMDAVQRTLVAGIAAGRGIDPMRRDLKRALNIPAWRAETIARTEAHRVFRETSRRTYAANADVLEGWVWTAHLDRRTCPACIAMHGTLMPVDAVLDGHPRCRCAMIPRTKPWSDLDPSLADLPDTRPPVERGDAWFTAQPAAVQRAMLGPGKYAALRDSLIDFGDVVTQTTDPRWGTMRREATLAEAVAAKRAREAARAAAAAPPVRTFGAQVDARTRKARIREGDWRYVDDRTQRAAVLLQNDYRSEQAVKKMAANLREGREPSAGVGVPRAWSKTYTGHVTDVGTRYTEQQVREALEDAARWLVEQDEVRPRTLYKGLDVPKDKISRLFREGAAFDTSYSSFTTDEVIARRYSSRRATQQVVVRTRGTSAVKVSGNPTAEHWKATKEHLVSGQGRVVKVVDDGRTVWVDVEF